MYQIKNIVNYDQKVLERELMNDMERFYNDKRLRCLLRRSAWVRRARPATSSLGLLCVLSGVTAFVWGKHIALSRIFSLLGIALSALSLFVLSSAVPKALSKITKQIVEILDTYGETPAIKYHMFARSRNDEEVEIWGSEVQDSKYKVILSATVDGHTKEEALICEYDARNPSGVLTLDVRNGVVLHM